MTDIEKLVAKGTNALCVEEVTTKTTYYNCFGDKIDESIKTTSSVFIFDETKCEWVKGMRGEEE